MTWTAERQREYQREYQKAWRAANPEKVREIQRNHWERNRDRINAVKRARRVLNGDREREKDRAQRAKDPGRNQHGRWIKQDRAAMWAAQDGKCYLCGEPMDPDRVRIDHDHECCPPNQSCRICRRGLVHHRCNIAIGMADDDPRRLRRMADALETAQVTFAKRKSAAPEQLVLSDLG